MRTGRACAIDQPRSSPGQAYPAGIAGNPGVQPRARAITMWATRHTRMPMLLLRLSGGVALRWGARRFLVLLLSVVLQ